MKFQRAAFSIFFLSLFAFAALALTTLRVEFPASGANLSGTITLNITTDEGADNITWFFFNASGLVLNVTASNISVDQTGFNFTLDTTLLPDGSYNLTINATNGSGTVVENSSVQNLTIDNTAPIVTLVSPQNNTNSSFGTQLFNASVTDATTQVITVQFNITNGSSYILLNASNGASDYWNATLILANLAEEIHTLTVLANDTLGNRNTPASTIFTVDNTTPTVTLVNGSFATSSTSPAVTFNFTDNLFALATCTLYLNVTPYNVSSVSNATNTALTPNSTLSDADYLANVSCTDGSGNAGQSGAITLTVDTGAPSAQFTSPSSNAYLNESFTINVTSSGATLVSYRIENISTILLNYTNLSNQAGTDFWNATFNISSLPDGNYTLRINTTDSQGNTSANTTRVNIDDTIPSITSFACSDITAGASASCTCSATDNSEAFGGTVSTDIDAPSTSTAATVTANCTATDSAGNKAYDSDSFTISAASSSSSGGGSSSSGGYYPGIGTPLSDTIAKAGKTWAKITAGQAVTLDVSNDKIAVRAVEILTSSDVSNGGVDVSSITKPSSLPAPTGSIFQYLDISGSRLSSSSLSSATITFRVPFSWFREQNVLRSGVKLLRYNGGWQELDTAETRTDINYAYFEADTPGFSTFAIVATEASASGADSQAQDDTPIADSPSEDTGNAPEQGVDVPEPSKKGAELAWLWWTLIALAVAAAAFVIYKRRQ